MLGDAVNTAFRIQNLTRSLGSDILASREFFDEYPGWSQGKVPRTLRTAGKIEFG
jgi:class 3 adenylate cyclase